MIKEEKPIFLRTFSIVLILLVIEAGLIYLASIKDIHYLTGLSILTENFSIPPTFLLIQVPVILFILIFAYIRSKGIQKRKMEIREIDVQQFSKKSKTELDALYNILKTKKELSIRSIANLFKIEEDLAMEWARILESGELVTIDYPGFGVPRVFLKIHEVKEKSIEKPKTKKTLEKKQIKDQNVQQKKQIKNQNVQQKKQANIEPQKTKINPNYKIKEKQKKITKKSKK